MPEDNAVFVINHFVRNWGHRFIYDEKTLREAMLNAGFTNLVKCDLQESEDPALCNLENEARLPLAFLRLETLTLEAMSVTAQGVSDLQKVLPGVWVHLQQA